MLFEVALPHQPNRSQLQRKDYTRPLHVDCSVEYELPCQVKPPITTGKTDPLLMIHPYYFRKIEAQHRSPFINNLPTKPTPTSRQSRLTAVNQLTNAILLQSQRNVQHRSTVAIQQSHPRQLATPQIQRQMIPAVHYGVSTLPKYANHPQTQQRQLWSDSLPQPFIEPSVSVGKHYGESVAGYVADTYAIDTGGLWTDSSHSPLVAELFPETLIVPRKDILTGKYRQYLRTHRLHPYMSMATTAFPQLAQMQQIPCYNV